MLVLLLFSILVLAILLLALLVALSKPPPRFQWTWIDPGAGTLLAGSILWAFRSCPRAYEIYGAVGAGLFYVALLLLATGVGVAWLVCLLLSVRWRGTLLATGVVLFALVALRQHVLTGRLEALQVEAQQIVAYLEQRWAETGAYPGSLSGYHFSRPGLAAYVSYWPDDERRADGFALDYHPLNGIGVQHRYTSSSGWEYIDD